MVKVYGIIAKTETKIFIGTYTRKNACKIMMESTLFIQKWNDNHMANIYKLIFEME